MNRRGLTPLVGFVILVGITAVGAMSLFVAGIALADATQSAAEQEQAGNSMSEFASTADNIANGETSSASFSISGADDATTKVLEDSGHIKMWVDSPNGTHELLNDSLGAYKYENNDGEQVTYQGGGVWGNDGDGRSHMIEPPEFEYKNNPSPTVTYNHIKITADNSSSAGSSGEMTRKDKTNKYPNATYPNPVEDGNVYVNIESEYCGGWEEYFKEHTPSSLTEQCGGNNEITVKFSVPFNFGGMGSTPFSVGSLTGKADGHTQFNNLKNNGYLKEGNQSSPSPTGLINSKVETCRNGGCQPFSSEMEGGNTYYATGIDGEELTFDTTEGDIQLVVDGEFEPKQVEDKGNGDGNVTIFAKGPVLHNPSKDLTINQNADQFRILVHSDYQFGSSGAGNRVMHGFIYAPGTTVFIDNMDFHGGIVANKIDVQSDGAGAINVNPRTSEISQVELNFDQGGTPFYYLHLSETVIEIDDSGGA